MGSMGLNSGARGRSGAGVVRVGDDAVVVSAQRAGTRVTWNARRIAGVFGEEGVAGAGEVIRGATLVVPMAALWRREVELTGQSIGELREAVEANLSAFFPAPSGTRLLWDVVELRRSGEGPARACVLACPAEPIEGEIERLSRAGVEVTRVIGSADAYALLVAGEGDGAEVVELGEWGGMRHRYESLGWAGSARTESREGARVCDWGVSVPEGGLGGSGEWGVEHVALGGALAGIWIGGVDRERFGPPTCDLVGKHRGVRWSAPTWVRTGAVAAVLVVGLAFLSSAWRDREVSERDALQVAMEEAKPRAEEVDRMRSRTMGVVAAHDRLLKLEEGYVERWRVLAAVTEALPSAAWVERVEILDDTVTVDVNGPSVADVVRAMEEHAAFEQARQVGGETIAGAPGTSKGRVEAKLTKPYFPSTKAATHATTEGGRS